MEFPMSIKTKIAALAVAALAVTGGIASTTTQAQAKPFGLGWGVGAGLVGAAIVGSAIAASNDGYYYDGYRRCGWVRQFDAYGNYMGRVRTCGY
jgi:nitric oxide reductase large subunit